MDLRTEYDQRFEAATERRGRCYELARGHVIDSEPAHGAVLVHGKAAYTSLALSRDVPFPHAWVEYPDGSVWEPITEMTLSAEDWERIAGPRHWAGQAAALGWPQEPVRHTRTEAIDSQPPVNAHRVRLPDPPHLPPSAYEPVTDGLCRIDISSPDGFAAYELLGHCYTFEMTNDPLLSYEHDPRTIHAVYGWVVDDRLIGLIALTLLGAPQPRAAWAWMHPRWRGRGHFATGWRTLVDAYGLVRTWR